MPEPIATVYVLVDPRDYSIFYAGSTITPLEIRLSGHISTRDGMESHTDKARLIRELEAVGMRPIIRAVEKVPESNRLSKERELIENLLQNGEPLTNSWPVAVTGKTRKNSPSYRYVRAKAIYRRLEVMGYKKSWPQVLEAVKGTHDAVTCPTNKISSHLKKFISDFALRQD